MARYNEILVGRYNRYLQKLLSMKGEPPAPQLSSEIGASFILPTGNEDRYLQGWNLYAFGPLATALAGNNSAVRFRNPPNSNIVAVFTMVAASPGVTGDVVLTMQPVQSDLSTVFGSAVPLDTRSQQNRGTIIPSSGNNDSSGNVMFHAQGVIGNSTINFLFLDQQEIPLLPNQALEVFTSALNSTLYVNVMWRERFMEESERT